MARTRDYYLALRHRYQPESVKLVILAESPPTSGLYFYDPKGKVSEPLFAAFMKQIGTSPSVKKVGLRNFQQRGWILIDATYTPVNELRQKERNKIIERDYSLLISDLDRLTLDRSISIPVILIKANICQLLERRLKADGFSIVNHGRVVYFPSSGQQVKFHSQFQTVITEAGIFS